METKSFADYRANSFGSPHDTSNEYLRRFSEDTDPKGGMEESPAEVQVPARRSRDHHACPHFRQVLECIRPCGALELVVAHRHCPERLNSTIVNLTL